VHLTNIKGCDRDPACGAAKLQAAGMLFFRTIKSALNITIMTYQLNGNSFLFALNRTEIVDISPDDIISLEGFPGAEYTWTNHDSEFLENNPDDDIFLQVEKAGSQNYQATGILLKSALLR
jgi:hypothetical protein